MLTTLLVIAGVIMSIAAFVLYCSLKNAPDGHEDTSGFHIDAKSKPKGNEPKQSRSGLKGSGKVPGKAHLDAA
jgi:hypothetical protein